MGNPGLARSMPIPKPACGTDPDGGMESALEFESDPNFPLQREKTEQASSV